MGCGENKKIGVCDVRGVFEIKLGIKSEKENCL